MLDSRKLGKRVAFFRVKAGLSQEKLAEQSDLSTQFIGQIERGIKNPTVKTMQKICGALNITLSEFFDESDLDEDIDIATRRLVSQIVSRSEQEKVVIYQMLKLLDDFRRIDS